jgi:hypothetical protein
MSARNTIKKIGKQVVSFDENGAIDPLLTVDEAAAILRCSKASLDKWRLTGLGPDFVYVGRRVRYRRADLAAFVAAATRQSTSDPRGRVVRRHA